MKRIAPVLWLLPAVVLVWALPAHSQGNGQKVEKACELIWVSGEVDSVDWVGNTFSVRLYDPAVTGIGNAGNLPSIPMAVRFSVTALTSFVQQTAPLGFAQLAESDSVSVLFCKGYYVDPVAVRVVINNAYPKN